MHIDIYKEEDTMNYKLHVDKAGLPDKCWVRKGGKIYLNGFERRLPILEEEYEFILKENGIPYKKAGGSLGSQYLMYWNPECYDEEEIHLPLYMYVSTDVPPYRYMGDYTEKKVPTEETCKKALEMFYVVEKKEHEFHLMQEIADFAGFCKKKMNGAAAIGMGISNSILSHFGDKLDFKFEGDYFRYIKFCKSKYTSLIAVFNLSKIEPNSVLNMKAPEGKEKYFIGADGHRVKEWSKMLGVRRINIVS